MGKKIQLSYFLLLLVFVYYSKIYIAPGCLFKPQST